MAESKKTPDEPAPKAPTKDNAADDAGASQVQSLRDQHREQGYEGTSPSTIPNSEYALTTGPDSPSHVDMIEGIYMQRLEDMRGSSDAGS